MSRSTSPKRRRHTKAVEPLTSCAASGGKVRYPKRKRALTAMNLLKSLKSAPVKNVYRCPHCGDWHLTSREPRDRRAA